jgi:hypothetical protein
MNNIRIVKQLSWLAFSCSLVIASNSCAVSGSGSAATTTADDTAPGGGSGSIAGAPTPAPTGTTITVNSNGGPPPGFMAFYSYVTQPGMCVTCHSLSNTPLFAGTNAYQACLNLTGYTPSVLNFSDQAASTVVLNGSNGHCGNAPACSTPAYTTAIQGFMTTWAANVAANEAAGLSASEAFCSTPVSGATGATGTVGTPQSSLVCPTGTAAPSAAITYTTAPVAIPATLPALGTTTGAIVRWNLSTINPALASVAGSILEVQIQASNATTDRVFSPKMIAPAATTISNLHVLIDGCEAPFTDDWAVGTSAVAATIAATTIPNPLPATTITATELSTASVDIPLASPSPVPTGTPVTPVQMISIGFEKL